MPPPPLSQPPGAPPSAPPSALSGQTALCALVQPTKGDEAPEEALDTFPVPMQLKIGHSKSKGGKKIGLRNGIFGNGISVFKVASKNGKRQPRRIAISKDNRSILVTPERANVGSFLKRGKSKKDRAANGKIEICTIDHIVRGQGTKKFVKESKAVSRSTTNIMEDNLSISIVFRASTAATSRIVEEEDLRISNDSTNAWGSIDLIINSHGDYEILLNTLQPLITLYKRYKCTMHRDILLLQHHWMVFGKDLSDNIHQAEWASLLSDRISLPLKKSNVISLYRKYAQTVSDKPELGISLAKAVRLLDRTCVMSARAQRKKDPCNALWDMVQRHSIEYQPLNQGSRSVIGGTIQNRMIQQTTTSYDSDESTFDVDEKTKKRNDPATEIGGEEREELLSAKAFLRFLKIQQKETKISLVQVRGLFRRLNGQTNSSQLSDDGATTKNTESNVDETFQYDYITKSMFCNYLRSDPNDAFNPIRGTWENDDMTQPLTSYWINSSNDTYLKASPPIIKNGKSFYEVNPNCALDVQMYTTALYRGTRCLDLDVWDGTGEQKGEPTIRFGNSNHNTSNKASIGPGNSGILFSDVLRIVRSFILSNPQTLPIILLIEDHCSIKYQLKMAQDLVDILSNDEMLYSSYKINSDDCLPSPEELRGKVIIKAKIPTSIQVGGTSIFDDYDDENDINPYINEKPSYVDDEQEIKEAVLGFEAIGSCLSDTPHKTEKSPDELVEDAGKEAAKAKAFATSAENKYFKTKVRENRAEEFAKQMLNKVGLTLAQAEAQLNAPSAEETIFQEKYQEKHREKRHYEYAVESNDTEEYDDDDDDESTVFMKTNRLDKAIDLAVDGIQNLRKNLIGELQSSEDGSCDSDDYTAATGNYTAATGNYTTVTNYTTATGKSAATGNYSNADYSNANSRATKTSKSKRKSRDANARSINEKGSYHEEDTEYGAFKEDQESDGERTRQIFGADEVDEEDEDDNDAEGIEIQHFYESTVEGAINDYSDADTRAAAASDALAIAQSLLDKANRELKETKDALDRAEKRKRDSKELAIKSAKEAKESKLNTIKTKEYIEELKQLLEECSHKANSAATVTSTAVTEAKISEDRAVEAEYRAKRANAAAAADHAKADAETEKEVEYEKEAASLQKQLKEAHSGIKMAKQRVNAIDDAHEKASIQLKSIENSEQYGDELKKMIEQDEIEQPQDIENDQELNKYLKKYRLKQQEVDTLWSKLTAANIDRKNAEKKKVRIQRALDEAAHKVKIQSTAGVHARNKADQSASLADQVAEYADEEREAANMRHIASERAEANLHNLETQRGSLIAQVDEAEKAHTEAEEMAMRAQMRTEKHDAQALAAEKTSKYHARVERKRKNLDMATKAHQAATAEKNAADAMVTETSTALNKNADVYHKAKVDASAAKHRVNAERRMERNAASAFKQYKKLVEEAETAREAAAIAQVAAARKASDVRCSKDYRRKKSKVREVAVDLAELTTIHSVKFRYFESSLTLPFNHMHSIAEGKMLKMIAETGAHDAEQWKEYNKNHLTRIYPSRMEELRKTQSNYNPVLPWSLGCQIASMNQHVCDAFVLVNDGRFRVNGSCGYVLKPEYMIERKGGDISRRNRSSENVPQKWTIKVLSGYNLPKPKNKANSGNINVRVRVTLYDGGLSAPTVHTTETVNSNSLNPIWNEYNGTTFSVVEPNAGIVLFSLWDHSDYSSDGDSDDFIAAAAIPISCLREGYRSVALFDSNHIRCGSHAHACLFINVGAEIQKSQKKT